MIIPDSITPIRGWRLWNVVPNETPDGIEWRLSSAAVPSLARLHIWPMRARMVAHHEWRDGRHRAPAKRCVCGVHAWTDLGQVHPYYAVARCILPPAVIGEVALWGRVILHERGCRAQFAYPKSVGVFCNVCFRRCEGLHRAAYLFWTHDANWPYVCSWCERHEQTVYAACRGERFDADAVLDEVALRYGSSTISSSHKVWLTNRRTKAEDSSRAVEQHTES